VWSHSYGMHIMSVLNQIHAEGNNLIRVRPLLRGVVKCRDEIPKFNASTN